MLLVHVIQGTFALEVLRYQHPQMTQYLINFGLVNVLKEVITVREVSLSLHLVHLEDSHLVMLAD